MWPRVWELALGAWLLLSPLVLGGPDGTLDRLVTWASGAAVLALSGSTFVRRYGRNHLGNLAVAAVLVAWGWATVPRPGPAWAQGLVLTGLVLGLVALVPTEAARPPRGWRRYVTDRE